MLCQLEEEAIATWYPNKAYGRTSIRLYKLITHFFWHKHNYRAHGDAFKETSSENMSTMYCELFGLRQSSVKTLCFEIGFYLLVFSIDIHPESNFRNKSSLLPTRPLSLIVLHDETNITYDNITKDKLKKYYCIHCQMSE